MARTYRINELCSEFEVTPRTLRFYEDKGLLNPRRAGSARIYSERDRTRLKLTLRGKRLGFTLEECREIIDMYEPGRASSTQQTVRLFEKICEHRQVLLAKLDDLKATLDAMNRLEADCLSALARSGVDLDQAGG